MAYWYPTQERADTVLAELEKLTAVAVEFRDSPEQFLLKVSHALMSSAGVRGFPQHQSSRWVWLASQFRKLAQSHVTSASDARAALGFLLRRLERPSLTEEDVQDLNWALDSTIRKLRPNLKPEIRRSNLSAHELLAFRARLADLADNPFDAAKVRTDIQRQLTDLARVSAGPHMASIREKIEHLFIVSELDGEEARTARGALLYLAKKDDIVADSLGVLGLVDDLYVIDWAFALVTQQTRCLPILEALLDKWPFVADLALLGNPPLQLDLFGQYIACASLSRLFECSGASHLVLRETAGFPAICALMAALQCMRFHADALERELASWPLNQAVKIGDSEKQFFATFSGLKSIGTKRKIWLGVGNSGSISIDLSLIPYIARRSTRERRLSDGRHLLAWLKSRHLDPLVDLIGSGRRSLETQECVLLVCPRHKIDTYFGGMNPFGSSAAALVGTKYVSSNLSLHEIDGQASDTPFIYACSDTEVALELLREPPSHVSGWRVIVDGARIGQSLRAALQSSDGVRNAPICILGEIHEREAARELDQTGVQTWYLESEDVQVWSSGATRPAEATDTLTRSVRRQGLHSIQKLQVARVSSEFLERLADCLRERLKSEHGDSQINSLDMAASSFQQRAIGTPLWDRAAVLELEYSARRIESYASTLGVYDQRAAKYLDLFKTYDTDTAIQFDRLDALRSLVAAGTGSIAVVCRSLRVADVCRKISRGSFGLEKVVWTTIAGLRVAAPFDQVIVPGWLARASMREIASNGYGNELSFLLFPFEERWFNSVVEANRRWERKLRSRTAGLLRSLPVVQPLGHSEEPLWRRQLEERIQESSEPDVSELPSPETDVPEFEQLESRAIASLEQQLVLGRAAQATAKARLVLFEDEGAYAFLHPEGKVIVLPEGSSDTTDPRLARRDAEALLFRNVATLRPGMVLAFSKGSDRDLIDARADQFIPNADLVRAAADLWKRALKSKLSYDWSSYAEFSRKMAAAGHARSPDTVRSWATNTNSIAPRNYREVVPLIANLTEDVELARRTNDVLASIDLVYRARWKAAEAIVREVFSGVIDPTAHELSFEIGGSSVQYTLHRVRRVAELKEVPIDLIGKVQSLDVSVAAVSFLQLELSLP